VRRETGCHLGWPEFGRLKPRPACPDRSHGEELGLSFTALLVGALLLQQAVPVVLLLGNAQDLAEVLPLELVPEDLSFHGLALRHDQDLIREDDDKVDHAQHDGTYGDNRQQRCVLILLRHICVIALACEPLLGRQIGAIKHNAREVDHYGDADKDSLDNIVVEQVENMLVDKFGLHVHLHSLFVNDVVVGLCVRV
jgi:hypothetical protein